MSDMSPRIPTSQTGATTAWKPPAPQPSSTGQYRGNTLAQARAQTTAPLTPGNQPQPTPQQGAQLRPVAAQLQPPVQRQPGQPQLQPPAQPPSGLAQGSALPPPLDASSLPDPQDIDIPDHLPPPPSSGGADVGGRVLRREDGSGGDGSRADLDQRLNDASFKLPKLPQPPSAQPQTLPPSSGPRGPQPQPSSQPQPQASDAHRPPDLASGAYVDIDALLAEHEFGLPPSLGQADGGGRVRGREDSSSSEEPSGAKLPARPQRPAQPPPSGTVTQTSTASTSSTPTVQKAALATMAATDAAKAAMQPQPKTSSHLIHGHELLQAEGFSRQVGVVTKTQKTALTSYLKELQEPAESRGGKRTEQIGKLLTRLNKAEGRIDTEIATIKAAQPVPTEKEIRRATGQAKLDGKTQPDAYKDYLPKDPRLDSLEGLKKQIIVDRSLLKSLQQQPDLPKNSGLTLGQYIELRRVGMPVDHAISDMATFNGKAEQTRSPLGSGAVNSVDKVTYKGVAESQVYKAAESSVPQRIDVVGTIGIDYDDPRLANRNVASVLVDQRLGLNLLPATHFASHGSEVGLVMTFAKGTAPAATTPVPTTQEEADEIDKHQRMLEGLEKPNISADEFRSRMEGKGFTIGKDGNWHKKVTVADTIKTNDPKLLQALSNLEWLDKITGQADRHPGNYLIVFDQHGNIAGLIGIDNDFAFGKKSVDPAPKAPTGEPNPVGHQISGLPLLVDSDTAKSIEDLAKTWNNQPGGMKAELSSLLSKEEVDAAEKRLTALVQHIQNLRGEGRVVPHDQWDTWKDKTGKSAHDVLATDMSSAQGTKWPKAEMNKSYLAKLETEAASTAQDKAKRV